MDDVKILAQQNPLVSRQRMAQKSTVAGDVTALLEAWNAGEENALSELVERVQKDLHDMAARLFHRERADHTLQPTAVVAEVYLRLQKQRRVGIHHRTEFFAVAAKLMRRVLVDHARRHRREKRGGDRVQVELNESCGLPKGLMPEILALDHALLDLERRSPRQSRIVEMRVMVGLNLEEIGSVEKISLSTVSREWKAARLFLLSQLSR